MCCRDLTYDIGTSPEQRRQCNMDPLLRLVMHFPPAWLKYLWSGIHGNYWWCNESNPVQWRHMSVYGTLINRLLVQRLVHAYTKEITKLLLALCDLLTLCDGNQLVPGGFLSQRSTDAENVSMSWLQHELMSLLFILSMKKRKHGHRFHKDLLSGTKRKQPYA